MRDEPRAGRLPGAMVAAGAYARTLWLGRTLRTRAALEGWQAERVRRWLQAHALAVPALAPLAADARRHGLDALPVIDKAGLLARFADYNRLGLDADEARRMADEGRAPPGHAVGTSTGTTGPRAPYIVSDRERYRWLGTLLAKALPDAPFRRHRVAVVLPRSSGLYDAANASRALRLLFVPTGEGLPAVRAALERFDPTVIVAPPHALRWLAERDTALAPSRVFSAAEVLDPVDRAVIGAGFGGAALGEIYMATEGLFAVTCAHGTLHLAEDRVLFELEPAGDGLVSPLVSPIVTDFSRRAQIMARYRMNDLLRLAPEPCPCGSPLRAVLSVEGRRDDAFDLPARGGAGGRATVLPDVPRDAVVGARGAGDARATDFRVVQAGEREVVLLLPPEASDVAEATATRLRDALAGAGADAVVRVAIGPLPPPDGKLRRVERRWRAGGAGN